MKNEKIVWSNKEDIMLMILHKREMSPTKISILLEKTINSVKKRIKKIEKQPSLLIPIEDRKYTIYALVNNGVPYYIGATYNIVNRMNDYKRSVINTLFDSNTRNVIKYISENYIDIEHIILDDNINRNDIAFWECHYIFLYRSFNFNMMNMSLFGGEGIVK